MSCLRLSYLLIWPVTCAITSAYRFSVGQRVAGWIFVVFTGIDLIALGFCLAKEW